MERGKNKMPLSSGIAGNQAAKNGRTCPLTRYLLKFIIALNKSYANVINFLRYIYNQPS